MSATAGEIFSIIWLCVFLPPSTLAIYGFYRRRAFQPIKARFPSLVVVSDIVLLLFHVFLCTQRIVRDEYPCWLTLWSGYLGLIVLCNTYVVRCWLLYYNYYRTEELLVSQKELIIEKDDAANIALDEWDGGGRQRGGTFSAGHSFALKYRAYTEPAFLFKATTIVTSVLLFPALIQTATDSTIQNEKGDGCSRGWSDALLAAYSFGYFVLYSLFAFQLRQVLDSFRIKEELRFTGIVAILCIIPWFLFNGTYESTNDDVFPFSTLALIVASACALTASTFWPLYRSIYRPPQVETNVPADINSLGSLLALREGFDSFKKHLTTEFSVENLLFWDDVRTFREEKANGASRQTLVSLSMNIYAKYIIRGSPYEVNLPGTIVDDLTHGLKAEYGSGADSRRGRAGQGTSQIGLTESRSSNSIGGVTRLSSPTQTELKSLFQASSEETNKIVTIFDDAVRNIFKLMETDSYQRYITTDTYRELTASVKASSRKMKVLQQMDMA